MTDVNNKIAALLRHVIEHLEDGDFSLDLVGTPQALDAELRMRTSQRLEIEALRPALVREAQRHIDMRASRGKFFPAELFGEPAWNMLLDLYVSKSNGVRITVTSACIASDAPSTTALRYIDLMVTMHLVARVPSSVDGRVTYLELTDQAEAVLEEFLRLQLGK